MSMANCSKVKVGDSLLILDIWQILPPWRHEAEVICKYLGASLKQNDFKPQPGRNQLLSAYFLVWPLTPLWVVMTLSILPFQKIRSSGELANGRVR